MQICADHSVLCTHAATGLTFHVQFERYDDTGALEWTGWFEHRGASDSETIRDVNILDLSIDCPAGRSEIAASRGAADKISDFEYLKQTVTAGHEALYKTKGSYDYMPFVNADTGAGGAVIGLGWTGNWVIRMAQGEKNLHITAGMPDTDFYLHPGERVRTPRVLLLPWEGAAIGGHNLLRRHMIRHHLPKGGDGQPQAPICLNTWGGMKTHNHLKLIRYLKEHDLRYDCYWIDAGWYGPDHDAEEYQDFLSEDWAYNQGEWRVNRVIHPDGLRPIADAAHDIGLKMLLWCAPFHCIAGMGWQKEHPEWGITSPPHPIGLNPTLTQFTLLYLDNPEAVDFLIDTIGTILHESGADYYREDTSLPMGHPDEEGRKGIGEMKAVEGFYRYWDGLIAQNPGIIIDNCGGGGHRIDLETMSRSYVFWRSDYNCYPGADPIGCQVGNYGTNFWMPMITGAVYPDGSTYAHRSGLSGGMSFAMYRMGGNGYGETGPQEDFDIEWHRVMLNQYRQVKPYFWGDYYPLTDCDANTDSCMAYQLDRPDLGSGVLFAFRRQDCETPSLPLTPVLEKGAAYEFADVDTGRKTMVTGGEDFVLTIGDKPGSALIFYRKV